MLLLLLLILLLLLLLSSLFILSLEIIILFFLLLSFGNVKDFFLEKNSLLIYLLLFIILFILNEELFSFIRSISGESALKFIVVFLIKVFISFSALSSSFISLFLPKFKFIFKSSLSNNIFCSLISNEFDLKREYILLK